MIFKNKINEEDYIIAEYDLEGSVSLKQASWELAIGQSVGNPHSRSIWETDELFDNHSCIIIDDEERLSSIKRSIVKIGFPIINTNWESDGITQLMVQLMGGNLDIKQI